MCAQEFVLFFGTGRATEGPHLAVRPALPGQPLDSVVTVVPGADQKGERAFGEVTPPLVLDYDGIPVCEETRHIFRKGVDPYLGQIRMADEHRGEILPWLASGEQDERIKPDAVAHRYHHHVLAVGVVLNVRHRGGVSVREILREILRVDGKGLRGQQGCQRQHDAKPMPRAADVLHGLYDKIVRENLLPMPNVQHCGVIDHSTPPRIRTLACPSFGTNPIGRVYIT